MATEDVLIRVREDGTLVVTRSIENVGKAGAKSAAGINLLKTALGGLTVGLALGQFVRMLDVTTTLDNRLRLVTGSQAELNAVYDDLLRISNLTRTSLADNADIFNRLSMATSALGLTYREQLDLTEQLNKALIISGASAQEGAAALRQLGQALGTGKLSGDEFVSVNENLPRVMMAVADSLGVTRGELKQMATDGKLTADVIVEAMRNASGALDSEFAKITPTIGGAFTVFNNQALDFVRNVNSASAIGEILANVILFMADNFNLLIGAVTALAVVMIGMFIPAIVAAGLAFAATPLGWFVMGLAAITLGLAAFGDMSVQVMGQNVTVWQVIKAAIATVVDGIVAAYDAVVSLFSGMSTAASPFFTTVAGWITDMVGWWVDMGIEVLGIVKGLINGAIGIFVGLIAAINPTITQGIPALFKLAMALAVNAVIAGAETIINIFAKALGGIGSALDMIPGMEGTGAAITEALTVDLSGMKMETAGLNAELTSARDNIGAAFGAAQVDYVGAVGDAFAGAAAVVKDQFNTNLTETVAAAEAGQTAADLLAGSLSGASGPGAGAGTGGVGGAAGKAGGEAAKLNDVLEAQKKIMEDVGKEASEFATQLAAVTGLMQAGELSQIEAFKQLQDKGSLTADLFAGSQEAMAVQVQQYQDMYAQIDALRQADVISEQTAAMAKRNVDAQYAETKLSGQKALFGELAKLSQSSNRTLAAIGKAAAVTQATIDGYLAIQKALASYPPPMNYALAAAIGATTAANVASILSTNTNFATGGSFTVPGTGGVDSQLIGMRASPGERVTVQTPTQVRKGTEAATTGTSAGAAAPQVNIRQVTIVDPALLGDYMNTPEGEELVMNTVRRNSDQLKQVLSNG